MGEDVWKEAGSFSGKDSFRWLERLDQGEEVPETGFLSLLAGYSEDLSEEAARLAREKREAFYGKKVFVRGLLEISNHCKNDCLYCGIRRSNRSCSRYRLTGQELWPCLEEGYWLGFRTFVLQGGEDGYYTDAVLTELVRSIKEAFPDCAVTLSLGERGRESFALLREAGADRYLLRHETADREHYEKLHPSSMSFEHRMQCLRDLKELGYQVGCGFMVGSPYQTLSHLAKDLSFIQAFKPQMCGIGPFVPHRDTPFGGEKAGSVDLTCYLLSLIRLIHPQVLLPSTTALGTLDPMGREKGILFGANVVMPNLSPVSVRGKYELYNKKAYTGAESAQELELLKERMHAIGYEVVTERGDYCGGAA